MTVTAMYSRIKYGSLVVPVVRFGRTVRFIESDIERLADCEGEGQKSGRFCKNCNRFLEFSKTNWHGDECPGCKMPSGARGRSKKLINEVRGRFGCMNTACKWVGRFDTASIDFHHVNQSQKLFDISSHGSRRISEVAAEIEKCITLCATCHRMIHSGAVNVDGFSPIRIPDDLREYIGDADKIRIRNESCW